MPHSQIVNNLNSYTQRKMLCPINKEKFKQKTTFIETFQQTTAFVLFQCRWLLFYFSESWVN